ncbi:hypothetical protein [Thermomonas alba]|uniref:hypothetical protein n=1 Tax=Thermomonas alba TaxID=2888525 RepID=UPI001F03D7B5|nr:hypothetical protein [Thermomonas alba]
MNVNSFSKKSAATAKPVKDASPLNDIGDVSAVAEMFQRLRQQNAQYDQAIAALVAANRIQDGWDKPAEPKMTLTIQREVLVGLGDMDALAQFDQEHQEELAQEQAARTKAVQQALEAPVRVKAMEQYINYLAAQMVAGLDESRIDEEIRRIFRPSARRMFEAAKTFVQAWREMQSMEAVLLHRVRLTHYSVTGDHRTGYHHELIGRRRDGELLPTLIEGLTFEELRDLNDQFTHHDSELVTALDNALCSAGFDGWGLKVYHPKSKNDERRIYAPDPNPPKKHLDAYSGMAAVVRVDAP